MLVADDAASIAQRLKEIRDEDERQRKEAERARERKETAAAKK